MFITVLKISNETGNMTQEEKYLQWMEEFFEEDGETCKEYVIEASNNGKLSLVWGVVLYGRLGMHVRNYMRFAHPEIDEDFPNYGDFEDYSWELIQKLVEKWKQ